MSDLVVLDGAVVPVGPRDERVFRFDWDTDNLNAGVVIASQALQVVRLHPDPVSITSIVRSGTTATVVTGTDHGLQTGDLACIAGADQDGFNLSASVTVTGARSFTYTVGGSVETPATGPALSVSVGVSFDSSAVLSAAPYSSRSTLVRIVVGGPEFSGYRFKILNKIVTDETPAQTKWRWFVVVVQS